MKLRSTIEVMLFDAGGEFGVFKYREETEALGHALLDIFRAVGEHRRRHSKPSRFTRAQLDKQLWDKLDEITGRFDHRKKPGTDIIRALASGRRSFTWTEDFQRALYESTIFPPDTLGRCPCVLPFTEQETTMPPTFDFGEALANLRAERRLTRSGWNGRGQYIMLQKPDKNSKMTLPYLYIKTVDGELVPWLASQTDILADDWYVASDRD